MKTLSICTTLIFHLTFVFAQVPQQFSFQGAARKTDGKPVANEQIGVRISVISESALGTLLYQETHSPVTNLMGIFDISIGGGLVQSGELKSIDWSKGKYFLQLEIDVMGGTNYVNVGVAQLLSVPYALHAHSAQSWTHDQPIVQTGLFQAGGQLTSPGDGARLIWYPRKAAMAAGYNAGGAWDDVNLGEYSFATGNRSIAKGMASAALGLQSKAEGSYSVAIGEKANAIGDGSVALGLGTVSKAAGSVSVGAFNDAQDSPAPNGQGASMTDRIFQIGNGLSTQSTSNAFTVLRNGNVGIGKGTINPLFRLDVDGRVRLKHFGNTTAGIHFDNSQNATNGFVGMVSDDQLGFYVGNSWKFWVNGTGEGFMRGKLGIGADIFEPEFMLDVAGRARIRHNSNVTAGIYFNDSQNSPSGFVGMVNDEKMGFYVGNKWRFQVKGNGNVGIGEDVSEPSHLLDVGGRIRLRHHGNTTSGIYLDNSQGSPNSFVGMISDSELGFYVGNSWKFWTDATGNGFLRGRLGVGSNIFTPEYPIDVDGRIRIRHNVGLNAGIHIQPSPVGVPNQNLPATMHEVYWGINDNSNGIGAKIDGLWACQIWNTGVVSAASFSQQSDSRLKRNINKVSNSLNSIASLNGYHYLWKDEKKDQGLQTGVIAQEVEVIFPELVNVDEKGIKSVNYMGLIPHLIESIKALKTENQELVKANASLDNRLNDLEKRVSGVLIQADALTKELGK